MGRGLKAGITSNYVLVVSTAFPLVGGALDCGACTVCLTYVLSPGSESRYKGEANEQCVETGLNRDLQRCCSGMETPISCGRVPDLELVDLCAIKDPANDVVSRQDDLATAVVQRDHLGCERQIILDPRSAMQGGVSSIKYAHRTKS